MAKTENREINFILNLSKAMAEYAACAEECATAVRKAKLEAYIDAAKRITSYQDHGIRDDLVDIVFEKRLKLIGSANTAGELKKIMDQPKPHFDGNKFLSDPFSVPEEEMVLWSITSLKAPLMPAAFSRYSELFKQIFGVEPIDADGLMRASETRLEVN